MFEHEMRYMQQALEQAKRAHEAGEVPIGAIVVDPYGTVVGAGHNMVEHYVSQLEHAEVRAVRAATTTYATWRLSGCTLYVTVEPCTMCMGFAALSRIERVVYGASSPYFGFSLDRGEENGIYTRQVKYIVGGICKEEAAALLQYSFDGVRGRYGFRPGNDKD